MENKRFLIGSKAFFSGMEGFEPKDSDFLTLVKTGNAGGKISRARCSY